MRLDASRQDTPLRTERLVREYFERRSGWTVEKLDTGKAGGRAPDFRVCHAGKCFLCEVKTVLSVRSDIPYGPVQDYRVDERDRLRREIEARSEARPDRRLIMHKDRYEWLQASETELRNSYRYTVRHTQAKFESGFEAPLRTCLENSSVAHLPYDIRLDSDDLYVPSKAEMQQFLDWLENEIRAIHLGHPVDWRWHAQPSPQSSTVYWAQYPLHEPTNEHDTRHAVSVRLQRRGGAGDKYSLTVDVHCYGTLNVGRVTASVEEALTQLRNAAAREKRNRRLPRVVVLRFEGGLSPLDHLELLEPELRRLFHENDDLSAIAVLIWRAAGEPPRKEQGIQAWFKFLEGTPRVVCFLVYHNPWLGQDTEALDPNGFSDEWSTHVQLGE